MDDVPTPPPADVAAPEALALPSRDVRLEMLRLRLTAEGMVVNASGEIEPGPSIQAEIVAAQVETAAAQAEVTVPAETAVAETGAQDFPAADTAEMAAVGEPESAETAAESAAPEGEIRQAG